jgi:hypothetical protein
VNVYLRLRLTCHLLSASWSCRLYLCRSQEWALHSRSPAGFVYLELSWMHESFVFSSIQPYWPVAIAVFFYYWEFAWGSAPPPLSSGACHTLAAVGRLPLSKHTGGGGTAPASPASLFIYSSSGECPSPTLQSSGHPTLFATCHFFSATCLLFSLVFFSFFPGWGSVCPGGCADLAQGCLWEYHVLLSHLVVCFSQAG